jgi:hypothetical protein
MSTCDFMVDIEGARWDVFMGAGQVETVWPLFRHGNRFDLDRMFLLLARHVDQHR